MLGSVFSHTNGLHLFANMYVFWSFSGAVLHLIGKEQLAAVYISGGKIVERNQAAKFLKV